jgi:hypothetical protein
MKILVLGGDGCRDRGDLSVPERAQVTTIMAEPLKMLPPDQ